MENLDEIDYLAIGHVVRDLVGEGFRPGGTALFAAITATKLGYKVGVVTSTNDPQLLKTLQDNNISAYIVPTTSSTTFENIDRGNTRIQKIIDVASPIRVEHIPEKWRKTPIVHLGPVAQELDTAISEIFPPEAFIGITPQGWLRKWDSANMVSFQPWKKDNEILTRASVVIISPEDFDGNNKEFRKMVANAPFAVVTLGDNGALLYHEGKKGEHFPARPTQVADLTGAGDIFAAAFFIRFFETSDYRQACKFANIVASLSIEDEGIKGIPTRDKAESFLT